MVQYKVKADRAAENEEFIRKVFEELHQHAPDGIRYATFKQPDGVSFVHVASIETVDGTNPLGEMTAFKAFQQEIKSRCGEPPVALELEEIGSHGFFGVDNTVRTSQPPNLVLESLRWPPKKP